MMSVTTPHKVLMVYSIVLVFITSSQMVVDEPGSADQVQVVVSQSGTGSVEENHVLPTRRRVLTRVVPRRDRNRRVHVTHEVHHVVHKPKTRKRVRPITVVADGLSRGQGFDGSYVAVSGTPGRGAVHVVENVPSLGRDSVTVINGVGVRYRPNKRVVEVVSNGNTYNRRVPPPVAHPRVVGGRREVVLAGSGVVGGRREVVLAARGRDTQVVVTPNQQTPQVIVQPVVVPYPVGQGLLPGQTPTSRPVLTGDRLPLPECSYVNTDFPGDDIILSDDGSLGINAGSARACKARCKLENTCLFWTYKEGFNRDVATKDCFLKEGTPGLPVPRDAVPRIGFVSGTPDNNCICITSEDEADEVCPLQDLPGGGVYPWKSTDPENNNNNNNNGQGLGGGGIYGDPRLYGSNNRGGIYGDPRLYGANNGVYGNRNNGVYGNTGINTRLDPNIVRRDPFFPPVQVPNSRESIEASVRSLRDQLDILSTKLGGQTAQRDL